jgi:hypothetical protein
MNPLVIFWPPSWREIKEGKIPIRIADLVAATNARRWILPYKTPNQSLQPTAPSRRG